MYFKDTAADRHVRQRYLSKLSEINARRPKQLLISTYIYKHIFFKVENKYFLFPSRLHNIYLQTKPWALARPLRVYAKGKPSFLPLLLFSPDAAATREDARPLSV